MREKGLGFLLAAFLLLSLIAGIDSISVTVNEVECVYEYVLYEGDSVSGNFVVVDHDIFWGADHPGIEFTVISVHSIFYLFFYSLFHDGVVIRFSRFVDLDLGFGEGVRGSDFAGFFIFIL